MMPSISFNPTIFFSLGLWPIPSQRKGSETGRFILSTAISIQQTSDGGYIIAGSALPAVPGVLVFWVEKTDHNGSMLWNITYPNSLSEAYAFSAQETPDGGYIIAGVYSAGILVLKTNSYGQIWWSKRVYEDQK